MCWMMLVCMIGIVSYRSQRSIAHNPSHLASKFLPEALDVLDDACVYDWDCELLSADCIHRRSSACG